jgi:hypothetical protein
MRIKTVPAIAAFALFLANAAWAQGNLEKAAQMLDQQSRAGKGEFLTYLTGAAAAYRWIGVKSDIAGSASAYCPPQDMKLDGRGYAKIALTEYQQRRSEYAGLHDFPLNVLALALLRGLQEKYPCRAEAEAPAASAAQSPR